MTQLLADLRAGDEAARLRLLEATYAELQHLASALLARERPGHTLSTGALANEAVVKLLGEHSTKFENRQHFFGAVATAMRRLLVDHARKRTADKRGGDAARVELDSGMGGFTSSDAEVLGIDEELDRLAGVNARAARVVELRFYGGMTMTQVAEMLEIAESVAYADWAFARAWLYRRLGPAMAAR